MGIGVAELLIIVGVAILAFGGPAVIGFWLGYTAGRKSGAAEETAPRPEPPAGPEQPTEPSHDADE